MSKNTLFAAASSWLAALAMSFALQAGATGWTADVTPTAVTHSVFGGEIVQVAIAEAVDNSAGCSLQDGYVMLAAVWSAHAVTGEQSQGMEQPS